MSFQNTTQQRSALDLFDFTRSEGVMNREAAERLLAEEVLALHERFGTTPRTTPQEMAMSETVSVTYA